jgi:hypothetical protein
LIVRKKLPAFGKPLLELRRRGIHPLCVHLIYGLNWRADLKCWWAKVNLVDGVHPLIAIKPDDYAPGIFDFAVLSGLQVEVFDQGGEAGFYESPDHGPSRPWYWRFYALLGELASFAADVEVNSPAFEGVRWSAHELARKEGRRGQAWPFWWSDEIEEKNAKRRDTWCRAVFGSAAARGRAVQCA